MVQEESVDVVEVDHEQRRGLQIRHACQVYTQDVHTYEVAHEQRRRLRPAVGLM